MKIGASVRKICEKCRLIRRKGRIRVRGPVVVWASNGACDGRGTEFVDGGGDSNHDFQTESGSPETEIEDSLFLDAMVIDKYRVLWCHEDGELGGIDFGTFNDSFIHGHVMLDEEAAETFFNKEDAEAFFNEFYPNRLEECRAFRKEKSAVTREFNRRLLKKQLKNLVIFILLLAILSWRLFALLLGDATVFYLRTHSPYPRRVQLVTNFVGRVWLLIQFVKTGSISLRKSVTIFLREVGDLQLSLKSKTFLDPQAPSFGRFLQVYIHEYCRHAGIHLLTPFYLPIMGMFGIVLWIHFRYHKWKLPIMVIYIVVFSIVVYSELHWHFKGRFKLKPDRRGRRRAVFPYTNKKWK